MFTHTYETRYGDYKDFDTIKTGAVLDMIQDVAIKDSVRVGYGIHKLKELGIAWLLQGINVEFVKPASVGVPIDVSTGVKTLKGATSVRCCIVRQNGEIIANSVANWFLFNTEKNKICAVLPEMISAYSFYNFNNECFDYKKLKIQDADRACYKVRVSNQHIDTNNHLNNQKGADLLMDALPRDFELKKANILYKNPAYLGDELNVFTKEIPNGYYIHLQNESGDVCVAGSFENK